MKSIIIRSFFLCSLALGIAALTGCSTDEPQMPTTPYNPEEVVPDEPEIVEPDPAEEQPTEVEPLTTELRPIITDGKKWVYEIIMFGGVREVWEESVGDITPIKYANYETLKGEEARELNTSRSMPFVTATWVKEENGSVMFVGEFTSESSPMTYDVEWCNWIHMNSVAGDEFSRDGCYRYVVESRGVIVLEGKTRRAVKFWRAGDMYANPYREDYWVEGIGMLFGIRSDNTGISNSYQPRNARMLYCYDGDELIYDCNNFSHDLYTPVEEYATTWWP